MLFRSYRFLRTSVTRNVQPFSSVTAPVTTSEKKMETDKRYKAVNPVPQHVLDSMHKEVVYSPGFSIKGEAIQGRPAYLDFQATTPCDPRVVDAMLPFMVSRYGNPHSRTHTYGWQTEAAVEQAREDIAHLIGASSKEIVFVSGATEANNMVIKGTEHKCVLDSCRSLEGEGYQITYLPVQRGSGLIDLEELQSVMKPETVLVSVMAVNNEIGVVQPLKQISQIVHANKGTFLHSDIAQMVGKLPMDVDDLGIDLASISSHKMYGPKGIGAVYIRRRPRVRLEPILSGGGQERGLRSGTLSPALCVGFGTAARLCGEEMERDLSWIRHLADRLKNGVMSHIPRVVLNGDDIQRYEGNLNFSFAHVEGESLLMALKNIAVSSGSACTSASLEPSYVLRAIGSDDEMAHSSIRFGIGRFTTEAEIDLTVDLLRKHVGRLREMSPLWEMEMDGIDLKTIQWTQDAH
eukprot:gene10093-21028_t